MPRLIKRGDKIMIEDHTIGDGREATDQEKARANMDLPDKMAQSVANANGETYDPTTGALNPFRRLQLTNLATNMGARRATLVGIGYDVTEVEGMQWAKLKGTKTWRPIDPKMGQGGFWEPTLDLFDLTTDAIKGYLATEAAIVGGAGGLALAGGNPAGAVAGAIAGGGAGMFLAEGGKQMLGAATGIKQNIDPTEAVKQGVTAAPLSMLPPVPVRIPTGGVIPQAPTLGGKISEGALTLSAKIAGTKPELLSLRGQIPGFKKLPSGKTAALAIKKVMDDFSSGAIKIPARVAADGIVDEASKTGARVNMAPMFAKMQEYLLDAGGSAKTTDAARSKVLDPHMPNVIKQVYHDIREYIDSAGESIGSMSPKFAEDVKRLIQDVADNRGAYGEYEVSAQAAEKLGDFGKIGRKQIEDVMVASGVVDPDSGKNYAELMGDVSSAMKYIGAVREGFYHGKTDAQKMRRALTTMKTLFGDTGRELLDAVEMLDNELGTNVYETVRQAALGKAMTGLFGNQGAPGIIPRFTAQGSFLGTNMMPGPALGTGIAGYALGGPVGAAVGAGYASPAAQLALVKAAQKFPALKAGTVATLAGPNAKRGLLGAVSAIRGRQEGQP